MINIIGYDSGVGTIFHEFDKNSHFFVNKNTALTFRNEDIFTSHLSKGFKSDDEGDTLYIGYPHIPNKISRRGAGNFDMSDINNCLIDISLNMYDNILLILPQKAIPFLQIYSEVKKTVDDWPTNDYISVSLFNAGYNVDFFTIDESSFGIPQHKVFGFYFASKNDFKPLSNKISNYFSKKAVTIGDKLKNITDDSILNNHFPDYSRRSICHEITPGSNAKKTSTLSQISGYIRLRENEVSKDLGVDFYKVSSRYPSIHPWYDRPLTIREGAYLS